MGLDFRKRSGRVFDGSKLNVDGQGIYNVNKGSSFTKIAPKADQIGKPLSQLITPTPSLPPTSTPTNTPTPTVTPTPSITSTVTPTPTETPTPTPTPACNCYLFENLDPINNGQMYYIDCNGFQSPTINVLPSSSFYQCAQSYVILFGNISVTNTGDCNGSSPCTT